MGNPKTETVIGIQQFLNQRAGSIAELSAQHARSGHIESAGQLLHEAQIALELARSFRILQQPILEYLSALPDGSLLPDRFSQETIVDVTRLESGQDLPDFNDGIASTNTQLLEKITEPELEEASATSSAKEADIVFVKSISKDWKNRSRLTKSQGKIYSRTRGMIYPDEMNMFALFSPEGIEVKGSPTLIAGMIRINGTPLTNSEIGTYRVGVSMSRQRLIKLLRNYGPDSPIALGEFVKKSGKTPIELAEELERQGLAIKHGVRTKQIKNAGNNGASDKARSDEESTADIDEADSSTIQDQSTLGTSSGSDDREDLTPDEGTYQSPAPVTWPEGIIYSRSKDLPTTSTLPHQSEQSSERERKLKPTPGTAPVLRGSNDANSLTSRASGLSWKIPPTGQTRSTLIIKGGASEEEQRSGQEQAEKERRIFIERTLFAIGKIFQPNSERTTSLEVLTSALKRQYPDQEFTDRKTRAVLQHILRQLLRMAEGSESVVPEFRAAFESNKRTITYLRNKPWQLEIGIIEDILSKKKPSGNGAQDHEDRVREKEVRVIREVSDRIRAREATETPGSSRTRSSGARPISVPPHLAARGWGERKRNQNER